MFGRYELRTQFIKVGGVKIHIVEGSPGLFRYRRDDVTAVFKGGKGIDILPTPAEGYGVKLLMIDLMEKVMVPPGESFVFYLEAPFEVQVSVDGKTIDRFQLFREKYALYGTPQIGAIARYWKSGVYTSIPEHSGVVKVVLLNKSKNWREVDHIVFFIKDSVMYYTEDRAFYPLIIVEFRSKVPEVNNTGKPPEENLTPTKEELPLPNFLMRW
ncbi:DUF432 domain-containing protein [Thermococcus sp.]|uniref:DUF432 domain-containing protein n=1 Tax=Thermococcus sp. TaxID=35749 RepID=UPI00260FB294|nr:DUF432 domain-containing protein [Thermococcus sp.]